MIVPLLASLLVGCATAPTPAVPQPATLQTTGGEGRRVLVIVNASDPDSVRLGKYYAQKRGVPNENLLVLQTTAAEDVPHDDFVTQIEDPIKKALAGTKNPIDFLLFVRGVPIRIKEWRYSVDSVIMSEGLATQEIPVGKTVAKLAPNPYFGKDEPFSHKKFGIYLACRLDGYTADDAKALVDRSLAAKPNKGPFLLDRSMAKTGGYMPLQDALTKAEAVLEAKGMQPQLDTADEFAMGAGPLAGYASWGSNDPRFDAATYHKLKFLPGALAETFVSTSGRTFRPTTGGQSLVADLIAQGVTGVKGYVHEPYTLALARPEILFDRYTSGRNLAESFYAASPATHWKDLVIGDPLCAPYRK